MVVNIQNDGMNDEWYMRMALDLASRAKGQTGTNPVVGCVIVKEGRIVGMGAHLKRGEAHAEIHALQMAGAEAEGATVYVTLEPCSHYGRTPPCSLRLVAERVARVVVACTDPNPLVSGRGIAILREAGIEVREGCLEQEALRLNEVFLSYMASGLPFVTLKSAVTLDGKVASRTGDSKWITGEQSRAHVHQLRHQHQGIMVGIETVLADDPQLNTRLPVPALSPIPIIADSRLRIPLTAKVLAHPGTIILTMEQAPDAKQKQLEELGAVVLRVGSGDRVNLRQAMLLLAEREIGSILLEGGGRLNGAMLEAQLVNKIVLFVAPKLIGGGAQAPGAFEFSGFERMGEALHLKDFTVRSYGSDVCMEGYPLYNRSADDGYGSREGGEEACLPDL